LVTALVNLKQSKTASFPSGTHPISLSHAFGGNPASKREYLNRLRSRREAGRLVRGTRLDGHGGCAIGCTIGVYDHQRYQKELGVPLTLVYLKELLFERLPADRAMEWPERFLSAIEPGSDLSAVPHQFVRWLLADPSYGVIRYTSDEMAELIQTIASFHKAAANGDTPPIEQLRSNGAIGTLWRQSLGSPLLERIMDVVEWAIYGLNGHEPRFAAETARAAVCVGIWGKAQAIGHGSEGADSQSWIELINTLYERQSDKIIELIDRTESKIKKVFA
jgi:hypothetical protein